MNTLTIYTLNGEGQAFEDLKRYRNLEFGETHCQHPRCRSQKAEKTAVIVGGRNTGREEEWLLCRRHRFAWKKITASSPPRLFSYTVTPEQGLQLVISAGQQKIKIAVDPYDALELARSITGVS